MRREIFNYFDIAAKLTAAKKDNRSFLVGSVAVRKDGTMVQAINSPTQEPDRTTHSEYRISKKCDVGAMVYVVRVRLLNGLHAMSRPCKTCEKIMRHRGISKAFYTIDHLGSYGVMDFDKNTEHKVIKVVS